MSYHQPKGSFAGFHANAPDAKVPELIFCGEQWVPTDWTIAYHAHPVWEFYLQTSGESLWEGAGQSYRLKPGSFFAAPPGMNHRLREHPKDRHHFYYAAIDLKGVLMRHPELRPYWRRKEIVFIPHGESVANPFRLLIREVTARLPHRTEGIRLALDYVVVQASRLFAKAPQGASLISCHPSVVRAKELLDHQYQRNWRLSDLAQMSGLSPTHLAERFTRDVGIPPHQYLLQVRVERAKQDLCQSTVPITELGHELGFSSSQHFASTFKRLAKITPSRYRAQRRSARLR